MLRTDQLTKEIEDLWMRIAAIDGWQNIEKKEGGGFTMFWGKNSNPSPNKSYFSIPDYPCDLNAIITLFKERNLYYQVAWMPTQQCARASDINDREFKGETEAITLCKLFLAIQENE